MGLEAATFISQLDNANPLGGDPINQGDDHIRLVKSVLQSQFPNLTAAAINATIVEFNKLVGLLATTTELNLVNGLLASTAELNTLNGILSSTAELNRLQSYIGTANRALISDASGNILVSPGVTTTELNILDGLLASTAELNKLNGLLASTAELDTMDGILSTTAELNRLQSFVGTINRAVITNGSGNLVVSGLTTTELNILDGATISTTELNFLNGVLGAIIDTQGGQTILGSMAFNGELILNGGYSEDDDSYTVTAGTKTLNLANATYFHPTGAMTAVAVQFAFSNAAASGRVSSFTVELSNMTANTDTTPWPANTLWANGAEPAWTAGIDFVTFLTRNAGTTWYGFPAGLDFS